MERSIILGVFATVALLLRVGLALYAGGLARSKNSAGSVLRSVCDLCTATLAFCTIGWAIQFQVSNDYLWADFEFPPTARTTLWPMFLYLVAVLASTGIVSGVMAERSRFFALCAASALLAGLVVPVAACWVQRGWLFRLHYRDVGGASWLHVTGGLCAAAGAFVLGPRQGKYHRDGSASTIPGHSVPMAGVGVLIAIPGWIAYVAGCQAFASNWGWADQAALNGLLAAAAGGMASLLYGQARYGKPDVLLTFAGVLGGLAAVSAGAGRIPFPWAAAVGGVAGILVPWAAGWIDLRLRIDDPTAGVAIHAVGGAWGVIAAGAFAPGGMVARLKAVGIQSIGLVAIAAMAGALSFGLFLMLKRSGVLRAKEADEFDGLDLAEHDIAAYPDFQQNTIRSYHMREA